MSSVSKIEAFLGLNGIHSSIGIPSGGGLLLVGMGL